MNKISSSLIGCSAFGLDDRVASADGVINWRNGFLPSSVLLPSRPFGPILCGDRSRNERIHSGLPWPPEAWVSKKGEYIRRVPVSLAWRALVEARDNQARWDIGGGVSFPLGKILASHVADLIPLQNVGERLKLTIPIPDDLDEYGQDSLLFELRRIFHEREIKADVQLLWRPVATALAWLKVAGKYMEFSTIEDNPDDFIFVLYLGLDAIECVSFNLRNRSFEGKNFIVVRRDRPKDISPLAGYDWIGGVIEQLPDACEGGDGAFWQAFALFPELYRILAEKELQFEELPRVWGVDKKYNLWMPNEVKIKEMFFQKSCGPSEKIQSILKSSCPILRGSHCSEYSWSQQMTIFIKDAINKKSHGRLVGMIVCGALAPLLPPDWLKESFPLLQSRGLNTNGPWNDCTPGQLWMSPGDGVIVEGATIFNTRLINGQPTYLDTLPQYFLLAKRDGRYTTSPLVDAQDVDGGHFYQNTIADRFKIEQDQPSLDIIIAKGTVGQEALLASNRGVDALDEEVGRSIPGISLAKASLIRHLIRMAKNREEAIKNVRKNITTSASSIIRTSDGNIRNRNQDSINNYINRFADLWHGISDNSKVKQDHQSQYPLSSERRADSPFRTLSFPFPAIPPMEMPVDIDVKIRPASGMANMEVIPSDNAFLHGRKIIVDYRSMRPCLVEELKEDVRGWPPLEELAPNPISDIWNPAKYSIITFERNRTMAGFVRLLDEIYNILNKKKLYSLPQQISLPMLNQDGIAGSQEGNGIIAKICEIIQNYTTEDTIWNPGIHRGQLRWLISHATWLYSATPSNVNKRIKKAIKVSKTDSIIIESASRSLFEEVDLRILFDRIAKEVQPQDGIKIQHIRAIKNVLTLRKNGQDALNDSSAMIFLNAILRQIEFLSNQKNYKSKFFESIKFLLYLLRYRKINHRFIEMNSRENEDIKGKLKGYLVKMEKCMTPSRFLKAKEIVSGTAKYLNFSGSTDFLKILTELSENDD